MAVTTTEYNLLPTDGWQEIANAASTFLLVGLESNSPWLFAASAAAPTAPVAAYGTLTLTGNAVADETVVINGTTLTWKASAANENQVTVGATAADSITNLVAKINAHSTLAASVAASDGVGDTVVVTALSAGTAGNSITTTETMTNASWGAATLASGAAGLTGVLLQGSFMASGGIPDNVFIKAVDDNKATKFRVTAAV